MKKFTITLVITFGLLLCGALQAEAYVDVKDDHWGHGYIKELTKKGVFDANRSYFFPDRDITRAELVQAIVRSTVGELDILPETPTYKDVPENSWFYRYVETATKLGIVQGYSGTGDELLMEFRPENPITRAEAAKIIINAYGLAMIEKVETYFNDVETNAWYTQFVYTLHKWSIVDGYRDTAGNLTGNFGPHDRMTRAQAAKIISVAMDPKERE